MINNFKSGGWKPFWWMTGRNDAGSQTPALRLPIMRLATWKSYVAEGGSEVQKEGRQEGCECGQHHWRRWTGVWWLLGTDDGARRLSTLNSWRRDGRWAGRTVWADEWWRRPWWHNKSFSFVELGAGRRLVQPEIGITNAEAADRIQMRKIPEEENISIPQAFQRNAERKPGRKTNSRCKRWAATLATTFDSWRRSFEVVWLISQLPMQDVDAQFNHRIWR